MKQEHFEEIYKEVRSVEPSSIENLEVKIGGKNAIHFEFVTEAAQNHLLICAVYLTH
jgi:hypothetical protein